MVRRVDADDLQSIRCGQEQPGINGRLGGPSRGAGHEGNLQWERAKTHCPFSPFPRAPHHQTDPEEAPPSATSATGEGQIIWQQDPARAQEPPTAQDRTVRVDVHASAR